MDEVEGNEEPGAAEDISAALNEAWDSLEPKEESPEKEEITEESPGEVEASPPAEEVETTPPAKEEAVQPTQQPPDGPTAPISWQAVAREEWAALPKAVKDEVMRRERDYATGIQQSREAAQRGTAYDQLLHPFQPMFSANGQTPVEGVRSVLQTAATLQMGAPQQKVQAIAGLIHQFGVDLQSLDTYLAEGNMPEQAQGNPQFEEALNRRLAPLEGFLNQFNEGRQRHQQAMSNNASNEVAQFAQDPTNEFYREVRADMADLLDLFSNRGVNLTLQDAYQKACAMNPAVQQVLETRKARQAQGRKQKVASSVSGAPGPVAGGGGGAPSPVSVADHIRQAWDSLERES